MDSVEKLITKITNKCGQVYIVKEGRNKWMVPAYLDSPAIRGNSIQEVLKAKLELLKHKQTDTDGVSTSV